MPDLCILMPCCKSKRGSGDWTGPSINLSQSGYLPASEEVARAQAEMLSQSQWRSDLSPTRSVWLYDGHMYPYQLRLRLAKLLQADQIDLLILSAGYGVIHGSERIHPYEREMDRDNCEYWIRHQVPNLLVEFWIQRKTRYAIGFFSKSSQYPLLMEMATVRLKTKNLQLDEIGHFSVVAGGSTGVTGQVLSQMVGQILDCPIPQLIPFIRKHLMIRIGQAKVVFRRSVHEPDPFKTINRLARQNEKLLSALYYQSTGIPAPKTSPSPSHRETQTGGGRSKYHLLISHLNTWISKEEADRICGFDTSGLFRKGNRPNQDRMNDYFAGYNILVTYDSAIPGPYVTLKLTPRVTSSL